MQRKKAQKYQNKKAFQIKFDTKALQDHKKIKLDHLCKRCLEQIQWKIQFNKYKKQTEPSKCNLCSFKVVVRSYHQVCDICAVDKNVCSKCMKSNDEVDQPSQVPILNKKDKEGAETKEETRMNLYLKQLRQRSKRKVMREYEKGNYKWDDAGRKFIDKDGNQIQQLKFKTNKQGDFGSDLDLGDDQEEILEQDEDQDFNQESEQIENKKKPKEKAIKQKVEQQQQKQNQEEDQNQDQKNNDLQDDDDFEDDQDQDDM